MIHNLSVIDKKAKISKNVKIGPFCYVGPDVELSENVELISNVHIEGNTKIGKETRVFPFACIGTQPQDLKFKNEKNSLLIGEKNIIREYVTINPGTEGGGSRTEIGNNCLFMISSHIAHDCKIGNENIFVNQVTLGGHVNIMNNVVVGGLSAIIQFVTIGSYSMIGGMSGIDKNVLPFSLAIGNRAKLRGLNLVGIRRKNFDKLQIKRINDIHNQYIDGIDLDKKNQIDIVFLDYSKILNQKLGHIQK